MTTSTKATKRRRRAAKKYVRPEHPCDRSDVRAAVFAIQALERSRHDNLAMPDYINHRRELHMRLGQVLAPEGGWFGRSVSVRLDVGIYRELHDQLRHHADAQYHGDFDTLVVRALEAGLKKIRRKR